MEEPRFSCRLSNPSTHTLHHFTVSGPPVWSLVPPGLSSHKPVHHQKFTKNLLCVHYLVNILRIPAKVDPTSNSRKSSFILGHKVYILPMLCLGNPSQKKSVDLMESHINCGSVCVCVCFFSGETVRNFLQWFINLVEDSFCIL